MSTDSSPAYTTKKSKIHNSGLFAARDIQPGEKIIEYVGEKITKAESDRRFNAWENQARSKGDGLVYIFELNKRYDIDGNVPYNTARLINHSCETNCEAVNTRGHIWICSTKFIPEGTELSYDYGYDMDSFMDHPCRCGTASCVGYIVRKDLRWRVKRLLKKK